MESFPSSLNVRLVITWPQLCKDRATIRLHMGQWESRGRKQASIPASQALCPLLIYSMLPPNALSPDRQVATKSMMVFVVLHTTLCFEIAY